ncbi:MAG: diguanylate cyclase [Chromatiales bacterium]|nr:diguanylate cyclase [Chromatiales bacterium]
MLFKTMLKIAVFVFLGAVSSLVGAEHAEPGNIEKVKLRLLWKHQFQFAGYYIAKVKGYYSAVGLDVDIAELDPNVNNAEAVLSEKTDFAVGRSSILIRYGQGGDIVALFPAFQRSPLILLTLASGDIQGPKDLKGRKIMITPDTRNVGSVLAMMMQAGIHDGNFIRQKHSYDLDDLVSGRTDAMASYISNEPFQLESRGVPYRVLDPSDHGFDMYSDFLFTSGRMIRERPEMTRHFYEASLRGWEYAFDNIEETAEIIYRLFNTQNKSLEALLFEGRALQKLAFDEYGRFGTLDKHRFEEMIQVYLISGVLDKDYNLGNMLYKPRGDKLRLSYTEAELVERGEQIRVCTDPHWMPYESLANGEHIGIIADYIQLISEKTGLMVSVVPTESWSQSLAYIKQGRCDIVSGVIQTPNRSRYLDFTRTYLSTPLVVASRDIDPEISPFTQKLAIPRGLAYKEIFSPRYPDAEFVDVESPLAGLKLVESGDVYGLLGDAASLRFLIQKHAIQNVYINETVSDIADISIGVTKNREVLLALLNKGIESITKDENNRILSHWLGVQQDNTISPRFFWTFLIIIAVLGLLGIYRYSLTSYRNKILETLAERDQLTGVANRHKLIAKLEEYLNISDRYNRALTLIYFDVDNFKYINDNFGHTTGDRVLIAISDLVQSEIRKTDIFGRWGGEEFLCLLPEIELSHATNIAEKLRKKISTHDYQINRKVTCSFGVAEYQPGETLENFVSRADEALYRAKHSGKNSVKT